MMKNKTQYLKIALLICLPFLLPAQVRLINDGVKIIVDNGTELNVEDGFITNQNFGEITNNGNIYLTKDFTQNSNATYNGGITGGLWFDGTTNQSILGDATLNISKLRVDNGNVLQINRSVVVSNNVDLTYNGKIQLQGANDLILNSGATISNYDANNFIMTTGTGYLQQQVGVTNVVFPIGFATYNPITIQNTGVLDNFRIRATNLVYDNGTTGIPDTVGVVKATWHVEEEIAGGSITNMTMQWNTSQEAPSFDRNNCAVSHWDGTTWDHGMAYAPATNIGLNTWTQTRVGQTSFSPFAIEDLDMELPVELLHFNAIRKSISEVQLDWSTASETNNQGFDIERMLENETEFTKIAWVDGNGTTTNTSYYDLMDNNGYEGVSYYRLKQIDFDGTFSYSDVKAISGWKSEGNAIDVFPNPIHDYINIRLTSECKEIALQILDAKGALAVSQTKPVPMDKLVQLDDLGYLADGVYLLTITTDKGEVVTKKIIKKQQ